ncbi:ABC transporter permease [Anaeromicropila herbilytica]|uniref:ABC transporter permease n=1 Tax=Anaeromicropila herbilytica TaxID=2785025 RepID=A0A7R7EKW3_9FIRM|nr:ABC-2 family transporter protein [Anaeromicropila herbilytica]BCN30657.1 ABC transporter permease [Anaeromicropila herbilytica]
MRKYLSFFRLRFSMGLQYRSAALAGIFTQFIWGIMEILVFRAFYQSDSNAFPMTMQATSSYIWLQEAFLALFMVTFMENEIFLSVNNGDIAYELCRPIDIYNMWFSRSVAHRLSRAVLRCMPILVITIFIPKPYGLMIPKTVTTFLLFLLTLILGLSVAVAFCMIIYMLTFFTISAMGVKMIAMSLVEFFAGAVIPLPFFPNPIRRWMELLPFASMQNVPLRIYSGDLTGNAIQDVFFLNLYWSIFSIV